MPATVDCRINPKIALSRTDTLANGVQGGNLALQLPAPATGLPLGASPDVVLTCSAAGVEVIALAASTPLNLNLAAIGRAGWKGDTDFSTSGVKVIDISNNEAPGSGRNLTVGGEGSGAEFTAPIGVTGDKVVIPPGTRRQFYTRETAGWTVSGAGARLFRLDPGSNPVNCTVVVAG
jgi:hypothetical protein